MGTKKTDNRSLPSKIAIRTWLLDQMGLKTVRVLDVCTGEGHIWTEMEKHCDITRWVKVDIKPRRSGTLKLKAVDAIRAFSLDDFDVVDIDTYGDPWDAYREVLAKLTSPIGVFLTHGHTMSLNVSYATLRSEGIPASWVTQREGAPHATFMPQTPETGLYFADRALRSTWKTAHIDHAAEIQLRRVAYYALAIRPLDHVPAL